MTSVVAGSMALLLVVLLAYPLMLAGIGQASPTCAEVGGSHEPMSDTRMSCCSSATQPQLAPTETYSSQGLKSWSVVFHDAGPILTPLHSLTGRHGARVPATTSDPPLFLQNASFLI